MSVEIQPLHDLDSIRQLIRIHDAAWKGSTGILDLLRNSTTCLLARGPRGRIVAYLFLEEDRSRGFFEIQDVVVHRRHRRKGYGRLIVEAAMARCCALKLLASANKPGLLHFYSGLGFEVEHRIENYYDVGDDAVRMSWRGASPSGGGAANQ
ncbi:MAG: GNAT family N-acetyltransferase [Pseudomonadota bacterium]